MPSWSLDHISLFNETYIKPSYLNDSFLNPCVLGLPLPPPPFTPAIAVGPNSVQLCPDSMRICDLHSDACPSLYPEMHRTQLNCADVYSASHGTSLSTAWWEPVEVFSSPAPWVDSAKPHPQDYLEGTCILIGFPSFHVLSFSLLFFVSSARISCLQTCNLLIILHLKNYKILALSSLNQIYVFLFFFLQWLSDNMMYNWVIYPFLTSVICLLCRM